MAHIGIYMYIPCFIRWIECCPWTILWEFFEVLSTQDGGFGQSGKWPHPVTGLRVCTYRIGRHQPI